MTFKWIPMAAGVLAIALTVGALPLQAQDATPTDRESTEEPALATLNLTQQQQAELRKIRQETKAQLQNVLTPEQQQQLSELRQERQQRQQRWGKWAALDLTDAQKAQIRQIRQASRQRIEAVLTPQQLEQLRQNRRDRRQERRQLQEQAR